MKTIKSNHSDEKWTQRMAMINSGKCVNTESHENDKLFKNDRATNGKGKSVWVCVKCGSFGHTASRCSDLKSAQSWKQTAGQ